MTKKHWIKLWFMRYFMPKQYRKVMEYAAELQKKEKSQRHIILVDQLIRDRLINILRHPGYTDDLIVQVTNHAWLADPDDHLSTQHPYIQDLVRELDIICEEIPNDMYYTKKAYTRALMLLNNVDIQDHVIRNGSQGEDCVSSW